MDETLATADSPLCAKIVALVKERGWHPEQFARLADLNRLTVRSIFVGPPRKLHQATTQACARALGITAQDLITQPLDKLLPRMRVPIPADANLRTLYEQATQPELLAWLDANPERAAKLSALEMDELLSLQGTGGPMTEFGVAHHVEEIERRRKILEQAAIVAGTEYVELLEQFVKVLYEKVQPYRDRGKREEA